MASSSSSQTEAPSSSAPSNTFHPTRTISNIKNHVSLVLDSDRSQYVTWVELFCYTALATGVLDHIDTSTSRPTDIPSTLWDGLDNIVKSWIYSTMSLHLIRTIIKSNSKAIDLWTIRLQGMFLDNQNSRAIYLEQKFNVLKLESYPDCTTYCKELKVLSDQLQNLGHEVSYQKLVLQLVAGLSPSFKIVRSFISHTHPLPTFTKARSMLLLEEANLQEQEAMDSTALTA